MSQAGPNPMIGRLVASRYEIETLLGKGGMGSVYAARHVAMKRRVALKILDRELSQDATVVLRFEREAQLASILHSPHIVTLFDYGKEPDGTLYLAMELIEGETLATRLKNAGALAVRDALDIGAALAAGVGAAHERGVVHRDLKPENVMLTSGGPKILDFGIAKILGGDTEAGPDTAKLTQAGAIVGTPMYMSPEAIARKPVGPPADLYSLGCILFEMIAGRPPFLERESVLLMGMHLRVPPEILSTTTSAVLPPGLDELVDQMLAKDPAARPPSAAEVRSALEGLARGADWSSPPQPSRVAAVQTQVADSPAPSASTATPLATVAGPLAPPTVAGRGAAVALGGSLALALVAGGAWAAGALTPTAPATAAAVPTLVAAQIDAGPSAASVVVVASEPAIEPTDVDAGAEPNIVTLRLVVSPPSASITRVEWDDSREAELTPCVADTCSWTHALEVPDDGDEHRLRIVARGYEAAVVEGIVPRPDLLVPVPLRRPGRRRTPTPGAHDTSSRRHPPSAEDVFGGGN